MMKLMSDQGNFTNRAIPNRLRSIPFRQVETDTESEEQLLLKHLSPEDHTTFWKLWGRYQKYLYNRCLTWMGGNHADAEEALSRARLKAWNKLPDYGRKITNLKAWLTRLTYHLCMDMHRERSREAVGIESIEEMAVAGNEIVASSTESPESAILRREMAMYIHHAIDTLPPRLRDVFILRCCQEMPYSDIAKLFNSSNANVRKWFEQARKILQKRLKKYLSGLDSSPASIPLSSPFLRGESDVAELFFLRGEPKEAEPFVSRGKSRELGVALRSQISNEQAPIVKTCIVEPINYKVTAICSLQHAWYSSPSLLGWR
jgi:RNA polymerase sigma-70 factor (ECF subfamily)